MSLILILLVLGLLLLHEFFRIRLKRKIIENYYYSFFNKFNFIFIVYSSVFSVFSVTDFNFVGTWFATVGRIFQNAIEKKNRKLLLFFF